MHTHRVKKRFNQLLKPRLGNVRLSDASGSGSRYVFQSRRVVLYAVISTAAPVRPERLRSSFAYRQCLMPPADGQKPAICSPLSTVQYVRVLGLDTPATETTLGPAVLVDQWGSIEPTERSKADDFGFPTVIRHEAHLVCEPSWQCLWSGCTSVAVLDVRVPEAVARHCRSKLVWSEFRRFERGSTGQL